MASSQDVYSEDDNFLIGNDSNTDRHRREARQLHLSQFRTTRREAHFARYRNSFLKCDLDQTNNRIEQERRLRSAEMERARAAIVKQAESRRKVKRYSVNENDAAMMSSATDGKPIILINNISPSREAKYESKDLGNNNRLARQSHRSFRHSVTNLSLSRASTVTGERACDSAGENEQVTSSANTGDGKGSSLGSNVDKQKPSEVNPSLNAGSAHGKESERMGSPSVSPESTPVSERNLSAKSRSVKVASNRKTPFLNRRKGSAVSFQESHAKKTQYAHERWVWTEFDKIMKGFADFLQIEHKSVKLRNEAAVDQDTKTRPPPNVTFNSRNTLSPFFFRYGVSDQIAFRF